MNVMDAHEFQPMCSRTEEPQRTAEKGLDRQPRLARKGKRGMWIPTNIE